MEHSDILISLSNEIDNIKDDINNIKTQVCNNTSIINKINASEVLIDGKLVYEGNIYSAYSFIRDLFIKAKNKLIIIDGYVDKSVLDMLDDINVEILIYTYPSALIKDIDIKKFSIDHKLNIIKQNIVHSRFIIIDDEIYQISESIKDIGKKRFVAIRVDFIKVEDLLKNMQY